jgi:ankyrin repeat protein
MLTVFEASLPISELSEHLMQWNACLVEKTDLFGNTPLHLLTSTGDTSIAEILLKKDERAGYREDAEGSLPIHVAAANGNLDFIKLLLEYCP